MKRSLFLILITVAFGGMPLVSQATVIDLSKIVTTPVTTINTSALKNLGMIKKEKNTEAFCSKFSETSDELTKKFSTARQKVDDFLSEESQNLDDSRNQRDAKLNEERSLADQNRSNWYAALEAKATTDDQKDAVKKFEKTLDAAVADRRESVDTAIAEFRKGVDDAMTLRQATMKSERDAFRTAFDEALDQFKTDCDNGLTTAVIRKNFQTNLKAARTKLVSDKTSSEKLGKEIHALAETRRTAVQKAITAYQATLQGALTDLKKALGETSQ